MWRAPILVGVLVVTLPMGAHADAIGPIPPCDPGLARGGSGVMGGMMSHSGAPPCEPAVCIDASSCGEGQSCRRDAHCIASREVSEMLPSPGHGAIGSARTIEVTRLFDLGRCEADGSCPSDSRCLEVSTCRAAGEVDDAVAASVPTRSRGARATGAWSAATACRADCAPVAAAVVETPPSPTPPVPTPPALPPAAEPPAPSPPSVETPRAAPPATTATCGCAATRPSSSSVVIAVLGLLAVRRARRRV